MIRGDFRIPPVQPICDYSEGKGNTDCSSNKVVYTKEVNDSTQDFDIVLDISIKIRESKKVKQDSISPFEQYMLNRNYKRIN